MHNVSLASRRKEEEVRAAAAGGAQPADPECKCVCSGERERARMGAG